jgi:hypothetical protein
MMRFSIILLSGAIAAPIDIQVTPACVGVSCTAGFSVVFVGALAGLEAFNSNHHNGSPKPVDPTTGATEPAADSQKPKFDPTQFNENSYKVVADIGNVTLPPTPAPSPAPAGYTTVKVQKKAIQAVMKFPISPEQATHPVMKKAIEAGIAKSIGKKAGDVQITAVNGENIGRSLRTLQSGGGGSDLTFEIISASDDTSALAENLQTAGTEGSLVANVKKEANDAGVLVPSLRDMALKMPEITATAIAVEREEVLKAGETVPTGSPTDAPTASATDAPTNAPTDAPTNAPTAAPTDAPECLEDFPNCKDPMVKCTEPLSMFCDKQPRLIPSSACSEAKMCKCYRDEDCKDSEDGAFCSRDEDPEKMGDCTEIKKCWAWQAGFPGCPP